MALHGVASRFTRRSNGSVFLCLHRALRPPAGHCVASCVAASGHACCMCSLTRSLPDHLDWDGLVPYAKVAFGSLHANASDLENVVGGGSSDVGAAVLRATSDQQAADIVRKQIEKDITDYKLAMEAYHDGESRLREEEGRALEAITKTHDVFTGELFKHKLRWVRDESSVQPMQPSPAKRARVADRRASWLPTVVQEFILHAAATSGTDESKVLVVNEIDLSIAGSLSTEALEDLRTTLRNLPGLILVLYPEMIGSKKAVAHAAALAGVRTGSLPTDGDAVPTSVVETTPGDSLTELWVERQRIDSYLSSAEVLKSAGGRWPLPINLNCEDEKRGGGAPAAFSIGPSMGSKAGMLLVQHKFALTMSVY